MYFCNYVVFDEQTDNWVEVVCWDETLDDAYQGALRKLEQFNLNPLPEECYFGKKIEIEVETRTVFHVVEVE